MTVEKGLEEQVADKIGEYVKLKGGRDLLEKLLQDKVLTANKNASEGLADMSLLFDFLDAFDITQLVSQQGKDQRKDPDLPYFRCRLIWVWLVVWTITLALSMKLSPKNPLPLVSFEPPFQFNDPVFPNHHLSPCWIEMTGAVVDDKKKKKKGGEEDEIDESSVGVGSIAAGGRYDNLVGMFSGTNKKGEPNLKIPCVGVSIGVERVFSILMAKQQMADIKSNETQVYVISVGDSLLKERMALAKELWDHDIKASFMFKTKPKLDKQFAVCEKDHIPLAVIIGRDEIEQGVVRIKDMRSKDAAQGGGISISRADMVATLLSKLADIN